MDTTTVLNVDEIDATALVWTSEVETARTAVLVDTDTEEDSLARQRF